MYGEGNKRKNLLRVIMSQTDIIRHLNTAISLYNAMLKTFSSQVFCRTCDARSLVQCFISLQAFLFCANSMFNII